jgi:hypothetical protein
MNILDHEPEANNTSMQRSRFIQNILTVATAHKECKTN